MTIPGSLIPQEPMSISLTVPADPPHYMLALWVMIALAAFAVAFMVFIYWRQQRDQKSRTGSWKPNLNCRCTVSAEERAAATGQLEDGWANVGVASLHQVHTCATCKREHIDPDRCPYCEIVELKRLIREIPRINLYPGELSAVIKSTLVVSLREYWLEHKRSHQKKK